VRRFGGHADVVGSPVRFADGPSRVVGVMPPAFFLTRLPDWGPVDCILPRLPAADQPRARYATVLARLVPGVGIANAQRELDYVAASVEREYADAFRDRGRGARVVPLLDTIVSGVRLQVWLLFAAAGAILAIGCVNITCLLLAQASDRRSELATRLALGASQGQLVRHAITEALVLAFAGGLAAALLAWWSVPLLVQWIPRGLPRVDEIAVDARVWLFALASSTVVGLACGLAGSVFAPRLPPLLSARGPGGVSAGRGRRVKQALVAGNLALAVVLLVTAGLLVRTMRAVDGLELGFVPANVISVGINTDIRQPAETLIEFESSLVDRIRALPGVLAAGIGSRPIDWGGLIYPVSLATQPDEVRLDTDVVGPGYLDALGARVIDGRSFTTDDRAGSPRVAMLNQAAAHRLFADGRAVGRTILAGSVPTTIVGVVADVRRRGLEAVPQPTLYLPTAQTRNMRSNNLLIRTAGDPTAIVPAVRAILYDLDPMQALSRIHVVDDVLDQAKAPRRFAMQLVGGFSLLAVILAMIGLYGVVAESVVQRVPEIGVRMALGATAAGIARMILTESALTMACGIGLGLAAAKALQDVMARAASLIPARRAASIDPLQALRRE
jgi:predicted permease